MENGQNTTYQGEGRINNNALKLWKQLLTLDKLKLVSHIKSILVLDESRFTCDIIGGQLTRLKYRQKKPYLLSIDVNYSDNEVVVEFTGKVLGGEYPRLITKETIRRCFNNINSLGFCVLDIEAMMEAVVVKCDVTHDVKMADIPSLSNYVRNHLRNYRQYVCRKLPNGNLVLEKNVTSNRTKKRLTIYDKGKEMQKAENRHFTKENRLDGTYDGVCRIELNLNSKEQIRKALNIENTGLPMVLSSEANPILDFLNETVEQRTVDMPMKDKKTYLTFLVLKDCDFDLEKVEAKMRDFRASHGTSIKKVMEPYRALMAKLSNPSNDDCWNHILDQLRHLS